VLEAVQRRLDAHPEKMRQRRETVEHPFDTIKARMGATHFLMKTLPHVSGELALHVVQSHTRPEHRRQQTADRCYEGIDEGMRRSSRAAVGSPKRRITVEGCVQPRFSETEPPRHVAGHPSCA
jgi:hypothetical protein